MDLPIPLYSAAAVRELDRRAIEHHRIAGLELMNRAGAAAFRVLQGRFSRARRIAVVCGPGNNGGDGYVVARLAKAAGLDATVLYLGERRANGDAAQARAACEAAGVIAQPFEVGRLADVDVIVDALFGIGLVRAVASEWRFAIEAINACGHPVLSIDIPSGLHADTGAILGQAVRADVTVTFIGLKAGLFMADGTDCAGDAVFDDLGVPSGVYQDVPTLAQRLTPAVLQGLLPRRRRNAHKGDFGHVLVVGGNVGMAGAVRLCGEAALRTGAGLVTVATHPSHAPALNAARPELIVHGVRSARDLKPLLERATVVALGPGLAQDAWARVMWRTALAADRTMVVDADALNLLAKKPLKSKRWILTPHPGEAGRLLKTDTVRVQNDRLAAASAIAKRYGGVCVLKGAGTAITSTDATMLCDRGNPGMATAGTGDVLTGVIAGLCAQGIEAVDAARLGVWVHASAGDDAARAGHGGLVASDIFPFIRRQLSQLADDTSRT